MSAMKSSAIMRATKSSAIQSGFRFLDKVRLNEVAYINMSWALQALWTFLRNFIFVLGSLVGSILRVYSHKDIEGDQNSRLVGTEQEKPRIFEELNLRGFSSKEADFHDSNQGCADESSGEESKKSSNAMGSVLSVCNNKYEFSTTKGISGFMEEPKAFSFVVHELCIDSENPEDSLLPEKTEQLASEEKSIDYLDGEWETVKVNFETDFVGQHLSGRQKEQGKVEELVESEKSERGEDVVERLNSEEEVEEAEDFKGDSFVEVDPDMKEEMVPYDLVLKGDDLSANCLLQPRQDDESSLKYFRLFDRKILEVESGLATDQGDNTDDEIIELSPQLRARGIFQEENHHTDASINLREVEVLKSKEDEPIPSLREDSDSVGQNELQKPKSMSHLKEDDDLFEGPISMEDESIPNLKDDDDSDDEDEQDILMEQLKAELKKARTRGLPTILEESEALELLQDLKPLKIDDKFEVKGGFTQIQKVYKNYSDKMRKLDVLNSQTMHSISLLKLKDPGQSKAAGESSATATKSLLRRKLWRFKQRRWDFDQIRDLHRDFETVYVGQLCLSWDILQWEYAKSEEILHHDPQGLSSYNQVAEEFQLFQVVVQRFVEDEPFSKFTRVENYVRNRRAFHNFLQIPLVRGDRSREINKRNYEEDSVITIPALRETIRETMRVFWEFLRTDKYEQAGAISKSHHQTRVTPQELDDEADLLASTRSQLVKKERRLKEVLRSGNCLVKKFLGSDSDRMEINDALFMAKIELALVSRALSMSKLRKDHLIWCQDKLSRIKIQSRNRKVYLEPSFSFFPC